MIRLAACLIAVLAPNSLLACACCVDAGHRSESVLAIDDPAAIARALHAAETAHLHMTPCGEDCVIGIAAPEESYRITQVSFGPITTLTLDGANSSGTLALTLSGVMTLAKTDLAPEPRPMAEVHTEYRIPVALTGTGAFATQSALPGELILSGSGNHCSDPEMMTHWTLGVGTEHADFRLFGRLGG